MRIWAGTSSVLAALAALAVVGAIGCVSPSAQAASTDEALINGCWPTDLTGPVLDGATATPAVDVTDGPAQVELSVAAHDEGGPGPSSGVTWVKVSLHSAQGPELTFADELEQTSPDGAWTGSITVPQWVVGGDWRLSYGLRDGAGNSTEYSEYVIWPEEIAHAVKVTSYSESTYALAITDYRIHEARLDTRRRARQQTFTIVGNERSGPPIASALVAAADRAEPGLTRLVALHQVSDRVWQGSTTIPRWAGTGKWDTVPVLVDASGYTATIPYPPSWPLTFAVRSGVDRWGPALDSLRLSPDPLGAQDGDAQLRVDARVRDRRSGTAAVSVVLAPPTGSVALPLRHDVRRQVVLHPAGASAPAADLPPAVRHSAEVRRLVAAYGEPTARRTTTGDAHRWTATVPWSACWGVPGSWRASLGALDLNGNLDERPTYQLRREGFPWSLRVEQEDRVPLALTVEPVDASTDHVDVTLTEDARGLTSTSLAVRDMSDDGHPVEPGSWTCRDSSGRDVDCEAGPVRSARYTIDASRWGGHDYGIEMDQEDQSLTDLAGNPCVDDHCEAGLVFR